MKITNGTYVLRTLFSLSLAFAITSVTACGDHEHAGESHHGSADKHHGDDHHVSDDSVGMPGVPEQVDRVITVAMNDDMRFVPQSIDVKAGETIKFELQNDGAIKHEMVIGKTEYLLEHSEMMKKFPGMEHEEPNMLLLEPSTKGDLIWKFTEAGIVDFACLQPGHYDAGMKGSVSVAN